MPYLISSHDRVDALTEAAIHLIDTEGVEALTLRSIAGVLTRSPSTLLSHLSSQHRILDLVAKRVGDSLVQSVGGGSIRSGMGAAIPDDELVPVVRAWQGLCELAGTDADRDAAVARIHADLRHVLGRIARLPAEDELGRDALLALTYGLWAARCSRTAPLPEARARAVLRHVCDALGIALEREPDAA